MIVVHYFVYHFLTASIFISVSLANGASLKYRFCPSLKTFEKCGKEARIHKKISVSVQSAKKNINKIVRKLTKKIFVAGYQQTPESTYLAMNDFGLLFKH